MLDEELYACLSVERDATTVAIRRAYKTAVSKWHPDRPGGDATRFHAAHRAFQVLSDTERCRAYNASGRVDATPHEEWLSQFGGGVFSQEKQCNYPSSVQD
jgi:DnaJ-class molecular chaperone